jgi:hypothetical protein
MSSLWKVAFLCHCTCTFVPPRLSTEYAQAERSDPSEDFRQFHIPMGLLVNAYVLRFEG